MISVIFHVQMSMSGVKMFYIDSCFIVVVVGFCAECTDTFHPWRHWNSSSSGNQIPESDACEKGWTCYWYDLVYCILTFCQNK